MQNKTYKILVIEDDKFFLDLYAKKFTENGFSVVSASNGKEAMLMISENFDIDLVIIDLLMPQMDGFEVLKQLKDYKREPRIIKMVLSNLYEDEDINHAFSLGCDDYIIKSSITPDEMIARVRGVLEKFNR